MAELRQPLADGCYERATPGYRRRQPPGVYAVAPTRAGSARRIASRPAGENTGACSIERSRALHHAVVGVRSRASHEAPSFVGAMVRSGIWEGTSPSSVDPDLALAERSLPCGRHRGFRASEGLV